MAVTFTPTFSTRLSANGGSALLVKGRITTTANDAVSVRDLGFSQIVDFVGAIVDGGDAVFFGKIYNDAFSSGPAASLWLCPLDNAHAGFPITENWPSNDYDVTFIAL